MASDQDIIQRRVPSLVQLCQRAAGAHVDSIFSLGDSLSYKLVKPVLERCTLDQLLRLEQSSPHLKVDMEEIWKDLCFRKFRMAVLEKYNPENITHEPESWKAFYFELQDAETKRIEEAGNKLRSQRQEADERKKEREVKFTDRVPPAKRPRTSGWGVPVQPKTLFQKTRSEASKIQKNMFNPHKAPSMSSTRSSAFLSRPTGSFYNSPPRESASSRVTVNTVLHRRTVPYPPSTPSSKPTISKPIPALGSSPPAPAKPPTPRLLPNNSKTSPGNQLQPLKPEVTRMAKTTPSKKDPMACLFVPKHKAYSQRPVQGV